MNRAGLAALAAAALAALVLASPAAAQPSPRWGSAQLGVGFYKPNVDASVHPSTTGTTATPWADVFGTSKSPEFTLDVARSLFTDFGSLDLGIGGGYFWKSGQGFASTKDTNGNPIPDPTTRQGDTVFHDIPLRVSLTYRFDVPVERWGIPLAPYARVAVERHFWWVTNSTGSTSSYNGKEGSGATNGMSFTGGVAFLLDFLDPTLAREMDRDTGINHTYLFAEATKDWLNNFGSATSWDLSNDGVKFGFGLLFVM